MAIKRDAVTAGGVAPNADSPGGELIRGWTGFANRYPGPEFSYGAIFGQGGSRLIETVRR